MKSELKNILYNFSVDKSRKTQIFKSIGKIKRKKLDNEFHGAHKAVFAKIDCLDCANCCKTTSPIFRDADIKRLSKHLRMKPVEFINSFLYMDKDHDYVLKTAPCSFLNNDNTCSVYDHRPLACREYPHTDRKNMYQVLELAKKNTDICPAVCKIVERLVK
ncbi:MAG: YkgJ family cysteine cluster protein [Crocinitomicaceae bacterium]